MRKRMMIAVAVLVPAIALIGAAMVACSDVECGAGTFEEGGKCVSAEAPQCGPGTIGSAGKCIPIDGDPCGENTVWDGDAGQCLGIGEVVTDDDGGVSIGARWTHFTVVEPACIATLANVQLPGYFADGTIVIITKAEPAGTGKIRLYGGTGDKISDDPLTYTYLEGLVPKPAGGLGVIATLADGISDGGVSYNGFDTVGSTFDWTFVFIPDQPPLYMYNAEISGTLDSDEVPNSMVPPSTGTHFPGRFTGCFTPTALEDDKPGAEQVYIEVLSQNMLQLMNSSGCVLDADCTNSGTNNGYRLIAEWKAEETLALVPAEAPDGGVAEDAGSPQDATSD